MARKKQDLSLEERLEQALVPEREQPYKVPENWVWTQIQYAFEVTSSKRVFKEDWKSSGIPFYRTRELVLISKNGYVKNELFITEEMYELYKKNYGVPSINDLLISGVGTIGVPYVVSDNEKFYFKDGNIIWFKDKGVVNAQYIYYLYKSNFMTNQIYGLSSGTTVDTYTINNAKKTVIPLPPLAEQQRIVDRIESLFEKLERAKGLIQESLDSFEKRKAAILHQAFSGELTKKWREENGVGMESWETKFLINIAKIVSGYAFKGEDFGTDHEIPCVKITNVGVGIYQYDVTDDCLPISYLGEYKRFIINEQDILISLTRSFINNGLKVCIYPESRQALLNQRVALIRYNNFRYLFHYLRTDDVLNYVKEKSKTTNQPNLSIKDLEKLPIRLPSLHEQQEIVLILDSLFEKDQQAKVLCDLIDNIDLMKKSILARAFRGELGTNDPAEESALELLREVLTR